MATIIFLSKIGWDSDPNHNPRRDIYKVKQAFVAGKNFPTINWTCSNIQSIQVGDKAYFKRVGNEPRGFFARGVIPAEPQLKRVSSRSYSHLSEAYSDIFVDGQFTVDIEWIEVVDYDKPLNTSELKKKQEFKGAFFAPRRSGSSFKEEYVNLLDRYWEAHLQESIKQGCGARRENI